jgi:hypothetical protein
MIQYLNSQLHSRIDVHMAQSLPESAGSANDLSQSYPDSLRSIIRLRCLAHVLQLAVKDGLSACPIIHSTLGKLRELCKKIHDSPKLSEALGSVCASLNVDALAVRLDVETRWDSTWLMVKRIRELRRALDEPLRRIRDRHDGFTDLTIGPDDDLAAAIPESKWDSVELYFDFLQPFKEATDLISGSNYPTLGIVSLTFSLMSSHATRYLALTSDAGAVNFITAVKKKLDEYSPMTATRETSIADALDPRVKNHLR